MNGIPDSTHSSADAAKVVRPEREELRAKLDQWILWVKRHIDAGGEIPSVLGLVGNTAEDSNGKDLLFAAVPDRVPSGTLETCWGDTLAQAAGDLGARAAVLCCAFWN